MKKYISILILLFTVTLVFGQTPITPPIQPAQGERLNLVSSNSGRINAKTGHMTFYVPVYEHKGNTLSADSGYLYEKDANQQFFEAFGNVVITQPSGTVIYADRLHYDATAQHARLTGNVKMVDKNSVLTTNYLTYNMRSKVGTYTGGGRIISQTDTITSQRAYYFENQGEAFFSKKVVVRNPTVKVYTDSMRYYSVSKDTHFYGPTNIKGNNKENLYTERGIYNTATGVARFNKNNLYTEGSRFLKGDSLYYDKTSGVGSAYQNVVFVDTTDKFYAYGNKGVYRQNEESILMTEKPYIVTLVKKDSNDKAKDSTQVSNQTKAEPLEKNKKSKKNKEDEVKIVNNAQDSTSKTSNDLSKDEKIDLTPEMDSVFMTADTLYSRMILLKDYDALDLKLNRDGGELEEDDDEDYGDDEEQLGIENIDELSKSEGSSNFQNSSGPASIKTTSTVVTEKPKTAPKKISPTKKTVVGLQSDRKEIEKTIQQDSIVRQKAIIPQLNQADSMINNALKIAQTKNTVESKLTNNLDSAALDTARTRIVKAFYNVRLYKSDLQAVADSVYYGMQDSMFRFMGRPMIWAQDSQISADTIFMQIINNQMDNALLKDNAFMVNATADSTRFNQLKGRRITAFFKESNIDRLFVDGNAENLVFSTNEKTKRITEMFHDRGSRIKVKMEGKEIIDYITIKKVDQKVYPFSMITQENEILPGFIWRPQDRPKSKEDLLNRKRELPKESESNEANTKPSDNNSEEIKGQAKKKVSEETETEG